MSIGRNSSNREKPKILLVQKLVIQRDYNAKLKSSLQRISNLIEKINTLDDVERNEILGIFGNWAFGSKNKITKSNLDALFTSIELESRNILELISGQDGLVNIINLEINSIDNFLGKLKQDIYELDSTLSLTLINFNQKKARKWEELRGKLNLEDNYVGKVIQLSINEEEDIVIEYLQEYKKLENLIIKENRNNIDWQIIYNSLKKLSIMFNKISNLELGFKDNFLYLISHQPRSKKIDERTFAENFFNSSNEINSFFKKYEQDFNNENFLDNLNEENKREIFKFLNTIILILFKKISRIEKGLNKIKDLELNKNKIKDLEKKYIKEIKPTIANIITRIFNEINTLFNDKSVEFMAYNDISKSEFISFISLITKIFNPNIQNDFNSWFNNLYKQIGNPSLNFTDGNILSNTEDILTYLKKKIDIKQNSIQNIKEDTKIIQEQIKNLLNIYNDTIKEISSLGSLKDEQIIDTYGNFTKNIGYKYADERARELNEYVKSIFQQIQKLYSALGIKLNEDKELKQLILNLENDFEKNFRIAILRKLLFDIKLSFSYLLFQTNLIEKNYLNLLLNKKDITFDEKNKIWINLNKDIFLTFGE